MAERLIKYYKYMADTGGLELKMKLVSVTKVPSTIAAQVPDSPEILDRFQQAIRQLTGKPAPIL
jgi:hypothetical protein